MNGIGLKVCDTVCYLAIVMAGVLLMVSMIYKIFLYFALLTLGKQFPLTLFKNCIYMV